MKIRKFMCSTIGHKRWKNATYEQYDNKTGELLLREHFCLRCKEWV